MRGRGRGRGRGRLALALALALALSLTLTLTLSRQAVHRPEPAVVGEGGQALPGGARLSPDPEPSATFTFRRIVVRCFVLVALACVFEIRFRITIMVRSEWR